MEVNKTFDNVFDQLNIFYLELLLLRAMNEDHDDDHDYDDDGDDAIVNSLESNLLVTIASEEHNKI